MSGGASTLNWIVPVFHYIRKKGKPVQNRKRTQMKNQYLFGKVQYKYIPFYPFFIVSLSYIIFFSSGTKKKE